jgi:hypothetical protein
MYSGWGGAKCGTLYMCVPLLAVLVLLLQAAFKEGRCSFEEQGKAPRPHGYPTDTHQVSQEKTMMSFSEL